MTLKEFAESLNKREYGNEITKEEEMLAKELGYVVVFGYSDDNMEFRGAIWDEFGCFNSGTAFIDKDGLIEECECECKYYKRALKKCKTINAIWDDKGYSWWYDTNIPHETFEIMEDEEKYCLGIVFDIKSL